MSLGVREREPLTGKGGRRIVVCEAGDPDGTVVLYLHGTGSSRLEVALGTGIGINPGPSAEPADLALLSRPRRMTIEWARTHPRMFALLALLPEGRGGRGPTAAACLLHRGAALS